MFRRRRLTSRLAVALLVFTFVVTATDAFAQRRRGGFGFGSRGGHFGHRGFGFSGFHRFPHHFGFPGHGTHFRFGFGFNKFGFHGGFPHHFAFRHHGFGFGPFGLQGFFPDSFGWFPYDFGFLGPDLSVAFDFDEGSPTSETLFPAAVFPGFAPFVHPFHGFGHSNSVASQASYPFFFHRPRHLPAGLEAVWVRPAWITTEQGPLHFPGGWAVSEAGIAKTPRPEWSPPRWEETENGSRFVPGQWVVAY